MSDVTRNIVSSRVVIDEGERYTNDDWPLWWMSFADQSLPKGSQFLGVVILRAPDLIVAAHLAHSLGVNPGGEIQAFQLPEEAAAHAEPLLGKLLSRAEAESF